MADDGEQEIDLSEIEKMLEEPETESVDLSALPEQDLDLDIEASLETEKWMSESGDDESLVKDEELDLSELEQALEDIDTEETDEDLDEPELDLDLGDDQLLGTPTETVAVDNELEFDLSDFEEDVPPKAGAETASLESVRYGIGNLRWKPTARWNRPWKTKDWKKPLLSPNQGPTKWRRRRLSHGQAGSCTQTGEKGCQQIAGFLADHCYSWRRWIWDLLHAEPERHRYPLSQRLLEAESE